MRSAFALAFSLAAAATPARAARLEADNPTDRTVLLTVDGAAPRQIPPFESLMLELPAGEHSISLGGQRCSVSTDTLVTADPGRSYMTETLRYSSELDLVSLDRTVQIYRHILRAKESERRLPDGSACRPVVVSWGLGQAPSANFRGPAPRPGQFQIKLYRLPPATAGDDEALAALRRAAAAYRPADRRLLLSQLEKTPWTLRLGQELVLAQASGLHQGEALTERMVKECGQDCLAAAPPEAVRRDEVLRRIFARSTSAQTLTAEFVAHNNEAARVGLLAGADNWASARALGELGLADRSESVRIAAVMALSRTELASEPALRAKVERILSDGPAWKAARAAFQRFASGAAASSGKAGAVELVLKLEGSDPQASADAAVACLESQDPFLHRVVEDRVLKMPKMGRRKLLLRWRDQPFPFSPSRGAALAAFLQDPEEFHWELAAKALLAKDYSSDDGVRTALADFASNPPPAAGWKFDKLKQKIDALAP